MDKPAIPRYMLNYLSNTTLLVMRAWLLPGITLLFLGQCCFSTNSFAQNSKSEKLLMQQYNPSVKIFDQWGMLGVNYPDNKVYLGTAGQGVYELDLANLPGAIQYRKIVDNVWITAMFVQKNGEVWIGTFDGTSYKGISIWRDGQLILLDERHGLVSNYVKSIVPKNENEILVGSLFGVQGINCPQGDAPVPASIYTKSRFISVNDIVCYEDKIFIASDYGLFSADGTTVTLVTTKNEPLNFKINSICKDGEGRIWLGVDKGVKLLENNKLKELTDFPGYIEGNIEKIKGHPQTREIWFLCDGQLVMFKEDTFRFPLKTILSPNSDNIEDYVFTSQGVIISQRGKGLRYIDLATRVKDKLKITDVKVQGANLEVEFPDSEYYTYNLDDKGWVEGALSDSLILSDLKPGNHKIEFRRISTTNDSAPSQVVEFKSYQQDLDYFFLVVGIALVCAIVFAIPVLKFTPDIYQIYLFAMVALFIGLLFLNNYLAIVQFKNQVIVVIPILVLAPLFYKFQRMVFRNKSISGEGELDRIYLKLRGFGHGSMNRNNLFRFIRLINHFKYKGKGSGLEKNFDETIEVMEQYVFPEMDDILKQLMHIGKYYLEAKRYRRVLGRTRRKDLRGKILSGKFDYVSTKELEQTYELFKMVRNELTEKFYNCDFFQCCRDVIAEFEGEFQKKGVIFNSNIDEGRDTKVIIKSYELCKILENLIENALASMEGLPEKRLQLEVTEEDADLTLRVTDTGHGIAKHLYGQVFEKDVTTKEGKSGGLGLYYSRETLTNYGGAIQIVESEKEHGTTMQVKLKILPGVRSTLGK